MMIQTARDPMLLILSYLLNKPIIFLKPVALQQRMKRRDKRVTYAVELLINYLILTQLLVQ